MTQSPRSSRSQTRQSPRREFLKAGGMIVGGTALAGLAVPHVHAAEDNTIRLALIGAGSRGSGAVVNAFEAPGGPVKLYAMAGLFENSPPPVQADAQGLYPAPVPGQWTEI